MFIGEEAGEIKMKLPILHRSQLFFDHKTFDGKLFKISSSMPMALEYCTKERAEYVAEETRKMGAKARIVKKRWVDQGGHSRVAYVVYNRVEK
jgi:hypothetical protein